jgi:hypothetical protein
MFLLGAVQILIPPWKTIHVFNSHASPSIYFILFLFETAEQSLWPSGLSHELC